jgi:hypothetical protein
VSRLQQSPQTPLSAFGTHVAGFAGIEPWCRVRSTASWSGTLYFSQGRRMFTKSLKRVVRERIEAGKTRRFHARDNAKAKAAYQAIVTQDPSRTLSATSKKRIKEYSNDVFGSPKFAPWLEVYSAHRGRFIEGWIPENYFMKVLVPSWTRYNNIDAKTIARRILGTESIPDLAYYINGFWIYREHRHLDTAKLVDHLFADTEAIFFKIDGPAQGKGVQRVTRSEFDHERLSRLGNFVVQAAIEQHPLFDQFTPDSVASLRITTVKPPGHSAKNKASILRLGHGGATILTADAIRVPVVDDQGSLSERAADARWISHTVHPDSQVAFSGKRIPEFQRAVAMCEKLHDESPFTTLIGWDIAIDRNSAPVIMEWNQGVAGIALSEASLGPCFKNLGWDNIWRKH